MPLEPLTAGPLQSGTVSHGFFTREGGVSTGIYASLNCGFGSSDERAHVAQNRARVAASLGHAGARVFTPYQVHGADIAVIDTVPLPDAVVRADAVVSRVPGLVIGILTADCVPVLFADAEAGVIAAAHAGWRGALGGVLRNTVQAMVDAGAEPTRIRAAIGPAISQTAYEVGDEFRDAFLTADEAFDVFFALNPETGRPHFDLAGFVHHQLSTCGLSERISSVGQCTHAGESKFFSYRRSQQRKETDYGRQISAIVLN